ncbi:hypothetical protein J2T07_003252 [Luteibacter jiangsuensis]|uniref:Uncharacterized protein n=2 Tax=Luteibacter jiangsuensis TaxID=637577 RepID=A0ABT9T329_9GAMM|nr:hypothetical protein [Luteibacter jiangsuensis]
MLLKPGRGFFFAIVLSSVAPVAGATALAVDPMTVLIREYSRGNGSYEYLNSGTDESYARYILDRPSSPYANIKWSLLPSPDTPTRRAIESVSTQEHPVNLRDLHDMKVWDLGFTKAHIASETFRMPQELRYVPGAWSIVKAGIEPDIYAQAIRNQGLEHPAMTANYALAAQLLRAKLAATPPSLWKIRGLRHDVLDRFVGGEFMLAHDFHYLIQFLDGALATWDAGSTSAYGFRQLPAPLRLGRIAAAYRQRLPFEHEPCMEDDTHDPEHAGEGTFDRRPLCFDDATDRAIHVWYAHELVQELAAIHDRANGAPTLAERMAAPLRSSRQGWIGIPRPSAIAEVTRIEVVEAKVTGQLLVEGDVSYRDAFGASRRALRLSCGMRP